LIVGVASTTGGCTAAGADGSPVGGSMALTLVVKVTVAAAGVVLGVVLETAAVTTRVPATSGRSRTAISTAAPGATSPSRNVATPFWIVGAIPREEPPVTNAAPTGSVTATVNPVALAGPRLIASMA